ncbi:DNA repair protein (mre11), variant [Verruconis gallopava]|uniref:Double-strand break repair protein n=1 Tax=Verruconis gallopava TaxID=253628 RepID=A0A0D2AIB3_9PEZI|nr:DNA repair protein (mre11) [Verruconis gallopava]XP_016216478.1 DNA repair protein (mre11), variant [Verruconis gallopava]KIW06608.1 DNA repair protein (mre11) [Verruconis gallopava]KIW06609.1 DNA repair protein (mre11), variant [Verruconis gallopava]
MPRQRNTPQDDACMTEADEITILVATDNHVGYNERDQVRKDDSWRTFHEIMELARSRDVDMVLLAGDLFHDNKPSRKSMFQVMRSLRLNCLGDRPCQLEMLSDASENFGGLFDHVNYEDENINVAIPVFSIHGNHDDPTEEGNFAALDLLQMSGLVNYFGKTPQADNITLKPILLQKGRTKLALYGMSNVRDERLFRTFRDGKVKFYQPSTQKNDWFNLMAVHQNHHAHTTTGYLPENFLPDFLDLVVWGHEHECIIEPRYNPEMNFHVIQPGSSVATSLMPGEAVPKKVALLKITGKEFKVEPIRLKTVRPFVMREIVLAEERALKNVWKKDNNRAEVTRHLQRIVEEMIEQAKQEYIEAQEGDIEDIEVPLPLIRLRVEYTAPDGGRFDCENPQRFSNRFIDHVANSSDVVQFYRKKTATRRKDKNEPDMPDEERLSELTLDSVKVEKLIKEYLAAQNLQILPQNRFGDVVSQFVDKGDKHVMHDFVAEALEEHTKHLFEYQGDDDDDVTEAMGNFRAKLDDLFARGQYRAKKRTTRLNPKPVDWDSDLNGSWEDQPAAIHHSESEDNNDNDEDALSVMSATKNSNRGRGTARGQGRGSRDTAMASTRKTASASKKSTASTRGNRAKKPIVEEEDDDEESDVQMVLAISEEDEDMFVRQSPVIKKTGSASVTRNTGRAAPAKKTSAKTKQSTLNFSQSTSRTTKGRSVARSKPVEISDDEISDDDDAFEPTQEMRKRRR